MHPRNEEGGELVVTGSDEIKIPLKDFPHKVDVVFKHKHHPPPCDPHHHHHDELEWEVQRHHHGHHTYHLIIKWRVYDIREIIWQVYYN